MESSSASESFTVLDWIGTAAVYILIAGLLAFPLAGRSFAWMYRDFGYTQLPRLTAWAISWWFPPLLALLPLGSVAQVFRSSIPLRGRRAFAVGAFVLALAGLALCLIGVYQPIFDLAGKIKAE